MLSLDDGKGEGRERSREELCLAKCGTQGGRKKRLQRLYFCMVLREKRKGRGGGKKKGKMGGQLALLACIPERKKGNSGSF